MRMTDCIRLLRMARSMARRMVMFIANVSNAAKPTGLRWPGRSERMTPWRKPRMAASWWAGPFSACHPPVATGPVQGERKHPVAREITGGHQKVISHVEPGGAGWDAGSGGFHVADVQVFEPLDGPSSIEKSQRKIIFLGLHKEIGGKATTCARAARRKPVPQPMTTEGYALLSWEPSGNVTLNTAAPRCDL